MANNFLSRWSSKKHLEASTLQKSATTLPEASDIATEAVVLAENDPLAKVTIDRETTNKATIDHISPTNQSLQGIGQSSQEERSAVSVADELEDSQRDERDSIEEGSLSIASLLKSDSDPLLKKTALRALFSGEEFNHVDALNDYDHDYSAIPSLSQDVAQSLREWIKPTSKESADETVQKESDSNSPQPDPDLEPVSEDDNSECGVSNDVKRQTLGTSETDLVLGSESNTDLLSDPLEEKK
ncbi:DUF3306 domain-containing protein [Vibrio genomosp. F10]|uniref:DUF3306 domain-containing protein n=1 Tax=Vibrio genomosp. F10 TaxID=723171 RepID=UPI0002DC188E|nr:DUF3306 domain-containing protein [Vibrio genomosp. F10]OEF05613.1 hypothetical protein A1QI_07500 [Vibrio genomosp. F10 str. 9ZB36]